MSADDQGNERNLPILDANGTEQTTVGNYFVSNYPPFSFWTPEAARHVHERIASPPPSTPLGLYVHIPFCRKRCDFCYFKVYTDKNSGEIRRYLDAVLHELDLWRATPYGKVRKPSFVYFGGGTPSYLSAEQLGYLFDGIRERFPWDEAREVAFECEPGTLQEGKVHALRELGVTRLSLGVENFDPDILELNNRAHRAKEIHRAYGWARDAGFPQVNIDLISGMVGETDANWARCIEETIKLAPESVTIYQMEVPYNTTMFKRMKDGETRIAPVADWETKRRWVDEAFAELERHGYRVGSAYTAVRDDSVEFLYRDALWTGADMLGTGVSSFGFLDGIHYQNESKFDDYCDRIEAETLPVSRAMVTTEEERMIRELVLQMKLGHVMPAYFQRKFGVDPRERYRDVLARGASAGRLVVRDDAIELTREGLLRVDGLLPDFFLDEHRHARYA